MKREGVDKWYAADMLGTTSDRDGLPKDMSRARYYALHALIEDPGLTQADIVDQVRGVTGKRIAQGSVSSVLGVSQKEGHVTYESGGSQGIARRYYVTEEGHQAVADIKLGLLETIRRTTSPEEFNKLLREAWQEIPEDVRLGIDDKRRSESEK